MGNRMTPDAARRHTPSPDYLRELLARAGLTQTRAALLLGISARTLRDYLAGEYSCPYPVQFCLECLGAAPMGDRPDSCDILRNWRRTA